MIRPFTCLCLAAACGSGLYLYSEKHRTALLDKQISGVIHATEAARARTGLLRAEWALLNEPGHLQDMADRYLALKPMAPTQFVQISELAAHLPPPGTTDMAADEAGDDADPAADPSAAAPAASPNPATADTAIAQGPPDAPADNVIVLEARRLASPKDELHEPSRLLARVDALPKPARHTAQADHAYPQRDGMFARGTPLPLATPQPVGARVYSAMAQPLPAYRPPAVAVTPHYVTPYVGSALAGRATLPPPTPYGGDQ
jgi:hypothetical protein